MHEIKSSISHYTPTISGDDPDFSNNGVEESLLPELRMFEPSADLQGTPPVNGDSKDGHSFISTRRLLSSTSVPLGRCWLLENA
jgi:hypothetical protein